jgi:hypothetical protein
MTKNLPITTNCIINHIKKYHSNNAKFNFKTIKIICVDDQDIDISIMKKPVPFKLGFTYYTGRISWEEECITIPYQQYIQSENSLI